MCVYKLDKIPHGRASHMGYEFSLVTVSHAFRILKLRIASNLARDDNMADSGFLCHRSEPFLLQEN
jgi:hypothetical protein